MYALFSAFISSYDSAKAIENNQDLTVDLQLNMEYLWTTVE